MDKLTDYIKVYDSVYTEKQCAHFINLIDGGEQFVGKVTKGKIDGAVDTSVKNALDVNISEEYPHDAQLIMGMVEQVIRQYSKDVDLYVPARGADAIFGRIYKEGDGFYKHHVDAGDVMTIDRVLSMLLYLTDVEGGELVFPRLNYSIQPKAGRMVVFPSSWMYVHGANMPTKGDRYVIRIFILGSNHDIRPATLRYQQEHAT